MSRHLYLSLLLIFEINLYGQQLDIREELLEQLSELQESSVETALPDQYQIEELNIKNINSATREELRKLPWLTNLQIESLLAYVRQNGPLVSIYELQAVPGWDLSTIRMTAALADVRDIASYYDPRNIGEQLKQDGGVEWLVRLKRRVQLSRGYQDSEKSPFQGSAYYWLGKFRYHKKGALDVGITAEKDPGERFTWNPKQGQYGADHLSMFLKLENKGIVRRLILGDFRAQWDQGLVIGNGLSFKKQVITGPRKVHQGFLVHSGIREYDFYRGIAMELQAGSLVMGAMYSYRSLDAQLLKADPEARLPVRASSITKTGLHRTQSEIDKRMQLPEQTVGLHIRKAHNENLSISLSGVYRYLKIPIMPTPNRYNQFIHRGKSNINLTTAFEYLWKNVNFYGQLAISKNLGGAAMAGFIASLSHRVSMSLQFRNYGKTFHGISSNAYSISSGTINEQGIYWGLQITPTQKWIIGSYANIFRFPHSTYNTDQLAHGMEQFLRVQFIPDRNTFIDLHWRYRIKTVNTKPLATKLTHDITDETKHSVGLRTKWQSQNQFIFQSRIQYSIYQRENVLSNGMIVGNQVSYSYKILRFTVSMAHFSTDNFENRQYLYEKDIPHSLSIPFFDGVGTRWFWLMQLKLLKKLDFWFKIAQTNYQDRNQVGSGSDTINGSKRTDLSLQIRYKL